MLATLPIVYPPSIHSTLMLCAASALSLSVRENRVNTTPADDVQKKNKNKRALIVLVIIILCGADVCDSLCTVAPHGTASGLCWHYLERAS
jgi:hypothetical protein